jgi:hypothetical protein
MPAPRSSRNAEATPRFEPAVACRPRDLTLTRGRARGIIRVPADQAFEPHSEGIGRKPYHTTAATADRWFRSQIFVKSLILKQKI